MTGYRGELVLVRARSLHQTSIPTASHTMVEHEYRAHTNATTTRIASDSTYGLAADIMASESECRVTCQRRCRSWRQGQRSYRLHGAWRRHLCFAVYNMPQYIPVL